LKNNQGLFSCCVEKHGGIVLGFGALRLNPTYELREIATVLSGVGWVMGVVLGFLVQPTSSQSLKYFLTME